MKYNKDDGVLLLFIILLSAMAVTISAYSLTYEAPAQQSQVQVFRIYDDTNNSELEELILTHDRTDIPASINLPNEGTKKLKFIFDIVDNQKIGNILVEYKFFEPNEESSPPISGVAYSKQNVDALTDTFEITPDMNIHWDFDTTRITGIKIIFKLKYTVMGDAFGTTYFLQSVGLIQTDSSNIF